MDPRSLPFLVLYIPLCRSRLPDGIIFLLPGRLTFLVVQVFSMMNSFSFGKSEKIFLFTFVFLKVFLLGKIGWRVFFFSFNKGAASLSSSVCF